METKKKIRFGLIAALVLALIVWWAWPTPLAVETAKVARGPLAQVVEDDGETRARDRYVVAAPVAGRLIRVQLRDGDRVKAGQLVAEIAPPPLSAADRDQLEAKLAASQALAREAEQRAQRASADHGQAVKERARVADLVVKKFMSEQALEQATLAVTTSDNELKAVRSRAAAAAAEVEAVRATMAAMRDKAPTVRVTSPVEGRVLRVNEKSERVVQSGTPLATLGDPAQLEVVVDLLSSDAVKVRPGMKMLLTGWGGPETLEAAVRLVEPAAFTKVSALGVEEQRVNIVADFKAVPPGIGDGYRVDARIVLAEKPDALKIPVGALFRKGDRWAVFLVENGKARDATVELGLRGPREAEVTAGLAERDTVILYPPAGLTAGDRVAPR